MTLMVTFILVHETEDGAQYAEQQQGDKPPAIGTVRVQGWAAAQADALRHQGHA